MGFTPVQPSSVRSGWSTSGLGTYTVTIPSDVKDGDLVVAFLNSNSNPGAYTPPAGWAISGSAINFNGGTNAVYTKVWHTGDPMTAIFQAPNYPFGSGNQFTYAFLVRSTNAASIVSHTTNVTVANSLNCPFTSFPPTRVGDLRIALYAMGITTGGASLTPPNVTPSAENEAGLKFQEVIKILNGGSSAGVFYSLWEDPSGADANTVNWTVGQSTLYCTRSLVFDDGDGIQPASSDEAKPYQGDVVIPAWGIDSAGQDADSANANWWGGGTNTLGDSD